MKKTINNLRILDYIQTAWSDEKFFTSKQFRERVTNLCEMVTNRYKNNPRYVPIKTDLYWNSTVNSVACTDNNFIRINMDNKLVQEFDKSRRALAIWGFLAHELGHCLYTDFTISKKFLEGEWDYSGLSSYDFYKTHKIAFTMYIKEIQNILEDPFVEYKITSIYTGSFKRGINFSTSLLQNSLKKAFDKNEYDLFTLLLAQARNCLPEELLNEYPCLIETQKVFDRLFTLPEPSMTDRCNMTLELFDIVYETFIKKYNDLSDEMIERIIELMKQNNQTSNTNINDNQNSSGISIPIPVPSDSMSENDDEKSSEKPDKKTSSEGDDSSLTDESEEKSESEGDSDENDGNDSDDEDSEDKEGGSDSCDDDSEEDSSSESDASESNSGDGDNSEETNPDVTDSSSENNSEKKFGNELNERNELENEEQKITRDIDDSKFDSSLDFNPEDVINSVAKTLINEENSEITTDFNDYEITNEIMSTGNYENCSYNITKIKNGSKEQYDHLVSDGGLKAISKQAQNKVRDSVFQKKRSLTQKKQPAGSRLDINAYARRTNNNDFNIFVNSKKPSKNPLMVVYTIVDASGSMDGDRIQYATLASIILEDFCRNLGIPFSLISHTDYSSLVQINEFIDFDSTNQKKDRYNLTKIKALSDNRDGFPIRYALNKIKYRKEPFKLIIVISDGIPYASGYYFNEGLQDITDIRKKCKKENVELIAFAIGGNIEQLKALYGEENLVDCRNLTQFPKNISRILAEKSAKIYK